MSDQLPAQLNESVSSSSTEDNDENLMISETKDEIDTNFNLPAKSVTKTLSADELLEGISSFVDNIMKKDYKPDVSLVAYDISNSLADDSVIKTISISSFMFEINHIVFNDLKIEYKILNDSAQFVASIGCLNSYNDKEPEFYITVIKPTCREAITSLQQRLTKLHKCGSCNDIYDTEYTSYCICCLFSDFFTKNNPVIICPVCSVNTKDFVTLSSCGHRFCGPCIKKTISCKCPLCRTPFIMIE